MMKHAHIFSLLSLIGSCLPCAQLQAQVVQESLIFEIPTDARSSALGGTLMADIEGDLHAAAYNPNLLDSSHTGLIALDYVNYFSGIGLMSVNYALPNKRAGMTQVGIRALNYGQFDAFDASGNAQGTFPGSDLIGFAGWNHSIDYTWTVAAQVFAGSRSLNREVALWAGVEGFVQARWPHKGLAIGAGISGFGRQWGWKGTQPSGALPWNLQWSVVKGFQNAPFVLFLKGNHMEEWDLAPPGTYDDSIDPLTGDIIPSKTFKFGDQLMRHIALGTQIKLGPNGALFVGYDYRRRAEMAAAQRYGTNGFAIGGEFKVRDFRVRIARNTYHFAGSSTHIGLTFNPRKFKGDF
jgi:hypothetical protein